MCRNNAIKSDKKLLELCLTISAATTFQKTLKQLFLESLAKPLNIGKAAWMLQLFSMS